MSLPVDLGELFFLGESKTLLQAREAGSNPFNEYFGNRLNVVGDAVASKKKCQ